jgi:DNA-binding response OmpR family regulator
MTKKLILAVDDEPLILSAIKDSLDLKFDIITAKNGKEALALIDSRNPDLVIMDVMMPEMDGFEAVRILHTKRIPTNPPIIFLSAKTALSDIEEGIKVGGFEYITKPFSPSKLEKKVDELFQRMEMRKKMQERKK